MFLGHFAVALGAKKAAPDLNLGLTIAAAQGLDLLWPMLVLAGVERVVVEPGNTVVSPLNFATYPYSHSLGMAALWGLAVGLLALGRGLGRRAGAVLGVLVLSHWFLDLLVHQPDMTLAGLPPKLGFGLWNHPGIEMPIEIGLLLGSAWLFARARQPRTGRLTILLAVLLAFQAFNWFAPQPTELDASQSILGLVAYGLAALVAWWAVRGDRRVQAT